MVYNVNLRLWESDGAVEQYNPKANRGIWAENKVSRGKCPDFGSGWRNGVKLKLVKLEHFQNYRTGRLSNLHTQTAKCKYSNAKIEISK